MVRKSLLLLGILALILPLMFLGCGDNGSDGSNGLTSLTSTSTEPAGSNCAAGGQKIETGLDTNRNGILDPSEVTNTSYVCNGTGASQAKAESCSVCHGGNPEADGADHQAYYDQLYQDGATRIAVTNLTYQNVGGNDIVTFQMTKAGADFPCTGLSPAAGDSLGIYFVSYDNTTGTFGNDNAIRLSLGTAGNSSGSTPSTLTYAANVCTSTVPESFLGDLSAVNGLIVLYGRNEQVGSLPARVVQNKYPFAGLLATGAGVDYASPANARAPEGSATLGGCEKCHSVPYLKHGYIYGRVDHDAANDFYTCKACHQDNGEGGHFEWQFAVSNPERWGEIATLVEETPDTEFIDFMTPAEIAQYAYTTRLMNDVHMSHAMEFPYPQAMSNCVVCHEGKLTQILTAANFTPETCKSCHPVTGPGKSGEQQPPSMQSLWVAAGVDSFHTMSGTCSDTSSCHADGSGRAFSDLHTGYNDLIYAGATGTKFANAITVSIDNATLNGTDLTIGISATGSAGGLDSANITPAVLVGLYGYGTKDFIVNGHDRWDSNCNGTIGRNEDALGNDYPIGEYVFGEAETAGCPNPYWTVVSGGPGAGPWVVTAHLATWADMINDGTIKKVEIGVMPELENAEEELVGLNAVSRTFVLATGEFDDNFFGSKIVDVGKCNNCHDQLATTFHSPDRGGSVPVCRLCHVKLSGGSHLEMQSRSIDSYVHAIHSMQYFDIQNVDFDNTVQSLHYFEHIEFPFPTHGIRDCEACHNAGTYNVPDQTKSLPGVLSASRSPLNGWARNIGEVPSYITGPAGVAYGACHRTMAIREDNAGELASLFSHWGTFGTLVEVPPGDTTLIYTVIGDLFSSL